MVKEVTFTQTPIPMCGEQLFFKRCPMKDLKIYDEQIQEKIKNELTPLSEETERLQDEEQSLNTQIENLGKKAEFIEMKDDPTDADLNNAMKYLDKQEKLLEELKDVRKTIKELDESNEEDYRRIHEEINQIQANKVEAMLDGITADEFLEKYDVVDMRIATYLSKYYEMCITGQKESKIRLAIQNDITEQTKREESFRRGR